MNLSSYCPQIPGMILIIIWMLVFAFFWRYSWIENFLFELFFIIWYSTPVEKISFVFHSMLFIFYNALLIQFFSIFYLWQHLNFSSIVFDPLPISSDRHLVIHLFTDLIFFLLFFQDNTYTGSFVIYYFTPFDRIFNYCMIY
jgi:hypothetical protein